MFTAPRSAPIADVARDASASAALNELSDSLARARDEGRMVVQIPLDQIETDHLVRDRMVVEEDEMQTLMTSLRSRGQQTPIEVVQLGPDRYGLISGWRRCRRWRLWRPKSTTRARRFWRSCAARKRPPMPILPWSRKTRSASV